LVIGKKAIKKKNYAIDQQIFVLASSYSLLLADVIELDAGQHMHNLVVDLGSVT
jgi:hypothetical protein